MWVRCRKKSMRFRFRFKYEYAALLYFKIQLSIMVFVKMASTKFLFLINSSLSAPTEFTKFLFFFLPMVVSIVSSCVKKAKHST